MAKRHKDALGIQMGACNPSGIAHSLVAACSEIRAEPDHRGTDQITSDPAVRLMVHQLAFICGINSGYDCGSGGGGWDADQDTCLRLSK